MSTEGIAINWQEGTVRVSASYSLKAKVQGTDYNMEDAHTSFSFEVPIPASVEDPATLAAALVELHAMLKDGVKLATLNELDVAFTQTGDGIVRPVITVQEIPVAAPAPTAAVQPAVEPAPQPIAPVPATAPAGDGVVVANFGFGEMEYYDNRPKKQSGVYKPNAADFKSKNAVPANNNQPHAVWLTFPNGGANHETQTAAREYGLI
jgi:hypothetical protein